MKSGMSAVNSDRCEPLVAKLSKSYGGFIELMTGQVGIRRRLR